MLTKREAMLKVKGYLDKEGIEYVPVNESEKPTCLQMVDCIVIFLRTDKIFGGAIEVQLRFREQHMYLMAYNAKRFSTADRYIELESLINHINATLCYETVLQHSLVLDEDTGDIYNGVLIRYETLESWFGAVMGYVLDFQIQLLETVSPPPSHAPMERMEP